MLQCTTRWPKVKHDLSSLLKRDIFSQKKTHQYPLGMPERGFMICVGQSHCRSLQLNGSAALNPVSPKSPYEPSILTTIGPTFKAVLQKHYTPTHTNGAFQCPLYPFALRFSFKPLQHPLQKTAKAHTTSSHTLVCLCFLDVANNSLEVTAVEKSKGSGATCFPYPFFCTARMLCSVGRVFEDRRTGQGPDFMKDWGVGGGVRCRLSRKVEEEERLRGIIFFSKVTTISSRA